MTSRGQIWKCNVCGNIIEVLHEGANALVCCGEPMHLMDSKELEEGTEKHKPVIDGKVVKVGSVAHPMEDAHYIEWIEATSDSGLAPCKKFLKPGDKPEVSFPFPVKSARAYCNVHGLWKS
jgi:superoxide reductase